VVSQGGRTGFAEAQYNLGMMYYKGQASARLRRGDGVVLQGAAQGNAKGQYSLGMM